MSDNEQPQKPVTLPRNGFTGWQMALGYISRKHSSDVRLTLRMYPAGEHIRYGARVAWGKVVEEVKDAISIPDAMIDLWRLVDRNHEIFDSPAAAQQSPAGYDQMSWFDLNTQDILHRLIWTTHTVFKDDWQIVMIYSPVANPEMRVQSRLLAHRKQVQVGARGPSLVDSARKLFHNAADAYTLYATHDDSE